MRAYFMIYLILTIPFFTANVGATFEESCWEKEDNIEDKGINGISDIIDILAGIAGLMWMIYTVYEVINLALNTLLNIFSCVSSVVPVTKAALAAAVKALQAAETAVKEGVGSFVEPFRCYVTQGWCGSCGEKNKLENPIEDNLGKIGELMKSDGAKNVAGVLEPMSNIYSATACLSFVGIVTNLKKYRNIEGAYQCCVERVCRGESNTMEACEKSHKESVCMFVKGGLITAVTDILVNLVTKKLMPKVLEMIYFEKIVDMIVSYMEDSMTCIYALNQIANEIPNKVQSVTSTYALLFENPDDVECDDIPITNNYKSQNYQTYDYNQEYKAPELAQETQPDVQIV